MSQVPGPVEAGGAGAAGGPVPAAAAREAAREDRPRVEIAAARRLRPATLGLALAGLTLAVFLPALHCGFVQLDDPQTMPRYAPLLHGLSGEGLRLAFTSPFFGHWAPLTVISVMLDWQLWGAAPLGHHLTNLLLHAANAVMVFLLWQRLTGRAWRALTVAALFALHPLRVEPVLWLTGRKDLLSAAGALLALLLYVRWREKPSRRRYVAVVATLGLALLAKATAVVVPGLMLLLDYWPLGSLEAPPRPGGSDAALPALRPLRQLVTLLVEKMPLLVMAALTGVGALLAAEVGGAIADLGALTLPERLANAVVGYARYLGKTFWPAGLTAFYPYHPWPWTRVAAAAALFATLTAGALGARRRWPWLTVGWLWWVACLLPVSGVLQAGGQAMADRYTYLASIGLTMVVVWAVAELAPDRRWRRPALAALAAVAVAACSAGTRLQIPTWRDSAALFRRMIAVTPDNHFGELNLGTWLLGQGRPAEAILHLRHAIELRPEIALSHANLGRALRSTGDRAGAEAELRQAIRLAPEHPAAHFELARVYAEDGRFGLAAGHLAEVIAEQPTDAAAWRALSSLLARPERRGQALAYVRAVARSHPQSEALRRLVAALASAAPRPANTSAPSAGGEPATAPAPRAPGRR